MGSVFGGRGRKTLQELPARLVFELDANLGRNKV
jgi:hypothetical protein